MLQANRTAETKPDQFGSSKRAKIKMMVKKVITIWRAQAARTERAVDIHDTETTMRSSWEGLLLSVKQPQWLANKHVRWHWSCNPSPKQAYAIIGRSITRGNSTTHLTSKLKRNLVNKNRKTRQLIETSAQPEKDSGMMIWEGSHPRENWEVKRPKLLLTDLLLRIRRILLGLHHGKVFVIPY